MKQPVKVSHELLNDCQFDLMEHLAHGGNIVDVVERPPLPCDLSNEYDLSVALPTQAVTSV